MFLRESTFVCLALLGVANAVSSCCFVVQDEAHEVYWTAYATEVYSTAYNLTSITTLLTPYPTTTITNYETNVYPTTEVLTTSFLVTENPVSLYTNPAYALPQQTEILDGTATITGGVTVASPTGFWVYSTAKVIVAPAVTDSFGNVACGTLLSFTNVPTSASACIPTFTAMNSNAAAYFASNNTAEVEISLTTPFVHIPTRAGLQVSPTEVCAQGNGTENYGYPVQELISHLAENPAYAAQYPGIENCIPAGPSLKAVKALAIEVTPGAVTPGLGANPPTINLSLAPVDECTTECGSTETPGGDITSSTTQTVTVTSESTTASETFSSNSVTSTSAEPGSTSSSTSVTSTSVPALPESTESVTSIPPETAISGGLLPDTSTSSSESTTSTSTVIVSPLPQVEASTNSNTTSSEPPTSSSTSSLEPSTSTTESSSFLLSNSTIVPESSTSSSPTSSEISSSSSEIISSSSTTQLTSSVEATLPTSEVLATNSSFSPSSVFIAPSTSVGTVSGTGSVTAFGIPTPSFVLAASGRMEVRWELVLVLGVGVIGLIDLGGW